MSIDSAGSIAGQMVTWGLDELAGRRAKERAAFDAYLSARVQEAVHDAARAVNRTMGGAAADGGLGSSGLSLAIAQDIETAGRSLLGSLLSGYDRGVLRRAGDKGELQAAVRGSLRHFFVETAGMGDEPAAFGGKRNDILWSRRDVVETALNADLSHHFSGYTSPPPQPFSQRHPMLKDVILVAASVGATKLLDIWVQTGS